MPEEMKQDAAQDEKNSICLYGIISKNAA